MRVEEITKDTFDAYAQSHIMKNYYQTSNYAEVMNTTVFDTMFIGIFDENILKGAALILHKAIAPAIKYGYSPRGILINYYDEDLLQKATESIKEFFGKKGFAFIKINPEITYSLLDYNNKNETVNQRNKSLLITMEQLGYKKLADNLYFESLLPKFNPIINLRTYDMEDITELLKTKLLSGQIKGLNIKIGTENDLNKFYSFIDKTKIPNFSKFENYYKAFKEDNMIDLFLIAVDYNEQLKSLQKEFYITSTENFKINDEFTHNPSDMELYNKKMESDEKVNSIRHSITKISNIMKQEVTQDILAGALLVKYEGRISLVLSGVSKEVNDIDIKFFLYYKMIEEYKKAGYKFLDLNGITGDFSDNNPFKNLNDFKLQFKPNVYEYVGELDLVINNTSYQILLNTNILKKEFEKEEIK